MGFRAMPQLANCFGYTTESLWVDAHPQEASRITLAARYIDDIIVAGPKALVPGEGLPKEEDYNMKYKCTSETPTSLLYLGVRFLVDDEGKAQCAMHDRAVGYPIKIDRYPEAGTVANPAQLGGVVMGRLVAAQRTCSTIALFKDVVAGIFTHCNRRHYSGG